MISIIVPIYNCEQYLKSCIDSVIQQKYADFELLLINDGSTDKSGMICEQYAKDDSRVVVINQKNKGSSAARNIGIKIAKGEYVIFLDSDDVWVDDKVLERLMKRLSYTNADVLSFNFYKFKEDKMEKPYFSIKKSMPINYKLGETLEYMYFNNIWIACAWNKIIKRELFNYGGLDFIEGITAEDIGWCAKLLLKANTFDYVDINVVGYRQRIGSVSNVLDYKKLFCLKKNIDEVYSYLIQADDVKKELLLSYFGYQVGVFLFDISNHDNEEERKQLLLTVKDYLPYMEYSESKKIKLMFKVYKIIGDRELLRLLNIYQKLHRL